MNRTHHVRRYARSAAVVALVALTVGLVVAPSGASTRPSAPTPSPGTTRPVPVPPTPPSPPVGPFVNHYVSSVATNDPVVFITVDDGTYRDPAFLALVRREHLPVTVFLTNAAASGGHLAYFQALAKAGAVIENHTLTHVDLARASASVRTHEICGAAEKDRKTFGRRATLLRPPYGAWDAEVLATAKACGLHAVIGWDAVMPEHGGLQTWGHGQQLRRGDIILMHFLPGLTGQVQRLLGLIRSQHLRVALLEDYV